MNLAITLLLGLALTLSSAYADDLISPGKRIGALEFVERADFGRKELGYCLRYLTKDLLKADVYVYNNGIRTLADGISSPEVQKEMESVKNALRKMEEMGKYQQVRELGGGVRKFENLKTQFLWARYSYQQTAGEGTAFTGSRISDLFLLARRGQFVKIRITAKQADLARHEPEIERFVREVAKQVEEAEPGAAADRPAGPSDGADNP